MDHIKRLSPSVVPLQSSVANTIYVDKDDETIKVGTGASGTSERILATNLAQDGSAASPVIAGASDPDSGMYFSTSAAAGKIRFSIDSNFLFGIHSEGVDIAGDVFMVRDA